MMNEPLRRFKADIFGALAHPARLAILDVLADGECSAGDLTRRLGGEQANVSQHLAVLRAKQLVLGRKAGNHVMYSIRDPLISDVLALMRTYFHAHLSEAMGMLDELGRVPAPAP